MDYYGVLGYAVPRYTNEQQRSILGNSTVCQRGANEHSKASGGSQWAEGCGPGTRSFAPMGGTMPPVRIECQSASTAFDSRVTGFEGVCPVCFLPETNEVSESPKVAQAKAEIAMLD